MKARGITQRGENTYRFSVSCGSDGNGKQIRKTTTFKVPAGTSARKAEMLAREAYLEFYSKCKNNPDFNENMRFSELVEIYLKQYAANELKAVTIFNYKSNLKNQFSYSKNLSRVLGKI